MLQAGAVGLLGLGMNHVAGLRALAANAPAAKARAVIYIFLSGGLAQQDSFDLKPDAPPRSAASSSRSPRAPPASRFANTCRGWPSAATSGRWSAR